MSKSVRRSARVLWGLGALLAGLFLLSFYLGRYGVPPIQVIKILYTRFIELFRGADSLPRTWTKEMEIAVINIRLPRIVMACLVGCSLSAAGAAFQGVFRNPMASPDILGASSGAAFGAALAILLGASSRMITVSSFCFGLITVALVMLVAHRAPGQKLVNLILAGIMLSSLFNAGTSYIKLVADPSNQLPQITYWLMGSLSGTRLGDIPRAFIPMAAGLLPLFFLRWQLNILSLGENEARTLGVNTDLIRTVVLLCATLLTASAVSVSGMIGWVGLVIPHLCRKLAGSDHTYLIPGTFLCGAAFLLLVDDISRNLLAVEIPIGILTACIGAPFFIYLITRKEKQA
ncbi:MAG: iron ABC transporter permease [Lachnospiraceae bacterium]|nr:iron ABC transporter permease [Lachnospiraceae bacterium]